MATSSQTQDVALLDKFQQKYNILIDVMLEVCKRYSTPDRAQIVTLQKGESMKEKKDLIVAKIRGFNAVCKNSEMTTRNVAAIFIKYLKVSRPHMWWDVVHDAWLGEKELTDSVTIEKGLYLPIGAVYARCKDIDTKIAENDSIIDTDKISTKMVFLRTLYELFAVSIQVKLDQGTEVGGQAVKMDEESVEYKAWNAKLNGALKCIRQCTMIIDGHDEESGDFLSMILDKIVPADPATGQKVSKEEIMGIFKDKLHNDGDITKLIAIIPDLLSGKSSKDQVLRNLRNNKMLTQMLSADQIDAFADTVGSMSDGFFKGGANGTGAMPADFDMNEFMSKMSSTGGKGKGKKNGATKAPVASTTSSASVSSVPAASPTSAVSASSADTSYAPSE